MDIAKYIYCLLIIFSPLHMKQENQNQIGYTPSQYTKNWQCYGKQEMPSVLPILSTIAKTCPLTSFYPVHKIMKAIAKIFMVNEIQAIFWTYLIDQTNWNVSENSIRNGYTYVQDIVSLSIHHPEYKCLILYLMVTAYTVKFYLNDNPTENFQEAQKICPNFKNILQGWVNAHKGITSKISLRTLNKVYQQLYLKMRKQEPDHNRLVDAIIQISPAYNPERKQQQKKNIPKQAVISDIEKLPPSNSIMNRSSAFSMSGIIEMTKAYDCQPQNTSNSIEWMNPFLLQKSQKLGSGQFNFLNGSYPQMSFQQSRQNDQLCNQIMLGLQDGESQENILFDTKSRKNSTGPLQSIITLTRGSSTDKFLSTSQLFSQSKPQNS